MINEGNEMTGNRCHMQQNEGCMICDCNCNCESTGEFEMTRAQLQRFAPEKHQGDVGGTAAGGPDGDETLAVDNIWAIGAGDEYSG